MEEEKGCTDIAVPLFFTGAVIGAVLGLLLAPVSGKDARESIFNRIDSLKERVDQIKEKIYKSVE